MRVAKDYDLDQLSIIHYPDPRLRMPAEPVREFHDDLAQLADRMLQLMRKEKGVGLAAPQVGVLLRLFVMNATGEPEDDLAIVNPVLSDLRNFREGEEGCLSIPDVRVKVRRAGRCRVRAQTLEGRRIELEVDDLVARVMQHETDHLNGVLIIDRMGPSDKMATRKALQALEESFSAR